MMIYRHKKNSSSLMTFRVVVGVPHLLNTTTLVTASEKVTDDDDPVSKQG